jgi:hypothetical protein
MDKRTTIERGFTLVEVLIIFVILCVIGGVGYLTYHNHYDTKKSSSTSTAKNTIPNAVAADSPYTGWDTYASDLGGFSFRYPATGWTLNSFDSLGNKQTGSEVDGKDETQVSLTENTGQGLSLGLTQYSININIGNQSSMNTDNAAVTYSLGTAGSKLSNGIVSWQTSENTFNTSSVPKCGNVGIVMLAASSGNNLYFPLSNEQYLNYHAGFCQGPGQTLSLSYQQQIDSPEFTVAKEVLASIKQ